MTTVRFPLVGSLTNRNVDAAIVEAEDQSFTNCYPELNTNPLTGKSSIVLNKRPGVAASADVQASASAGHGACVWTSNSASASPTIFSFVKSTATSIMFFNTSGTQIGGDVANTNACPFLTDTLISGTGNLTATLVDSGTSALEAWYFPEGGAWTQITDADFPSNIQLSHCHMDGYMFVITNRGAIHNSDLNSLSAWTSTSFINAQSMPDNGVGLARHRNFVIAFGDYSLEFFFNAGNATGSPLSRVDDSVRRVGALRSTSRAIMTIGDTVYWLGRTDSGAGGVYRLKGFEPEKISPPAIDKLVTMGTISVIAGSFTLHGKSHIAFYTASNVVLCFCTETGFWWWFTLADGIVTPASFVGANALNGFSYLTAESSAKIFSFNPSTPVWQDNSSAYTMTVRTDSLDHGTHKRKFYKSLALIGDTQSAASAVGVSYSDDDYSTFGTARNIDMNATQRRLFRLGSSRRRAWQFTHSANTPCRLEAVEIEYAEGSS